jgi:hypothetical protein
VRWSLAVLAVCACGDNVVGTPFSEFEAASDRARCERFVRCGLFTDNDACNGFFRKRPDIDLAAAVARGIVRYSGPAADECLAALAAQSCDTSSRDARTQPAACAEMFRGSVKTGDACALDEECASGVCALPTCNQACCTGTCHARRASAIGDACELDVDCTGDAFCGGDKLCHALGAVGIDCERDNECDYGLACIGPSQLMPGNCRAQPRIGEPCLYLRCGELGATCTAGTCVALGLPGAPCTSAKDCSPFAVCDTSTGACATVPSLGEPCTVGCAGEAWCDASDTHLCSTPKPINSMCSSDDQCASLFCDEGPIFDACAQRAICN